MGTINRIGDKLLHSNSLAFTFIRSIASSQTASWVDLVTGFALFAWVGLPPWLSTAIGAIAGGVINCIINYRFTFHASSVDFKAVIVKYAMVWIGSVVLNSFGTQAVYWLLGHWPWLETIGFEPDGYYATARLFTSLIVSWAWNFTLQRTFVYRTRAFDRTAISIISPLCPKRKRIKSN